MEITVRSESSACSLSTTSAPLTASTTPWKPLAVQQSADHEQTLATIRSRLSFFRARYDFLFPGGPVYRFWCEVLWKGVYACKGTS